MSRRFVIGIAAAGLLILAIGGFVAGSLVGPGDDPQLAAGSSSAAPSAPSATASPSVQPTPTQAATPTASPVPTPSPTPAGPPQELAVHGWATVTVFELNVRAAADVGATSKYRLVRGAVVHVAEGPVAADGFNWYRVASLGGAVGWAASGPAAEPFMTTLVDDPTLIRCGEVKRAVFDIVDGHPVAHDPLEVGDMALPASAFSESELGVIELLRGVGGEACFTAHVGSDGMPIVQSQLNVARFRPVTASSAFAGAPERAVDGEGDTLWNSGAFQPGWIEIDFGAPMTIAEVRLYVAQTPSGSTEHVISGQASPDGPTFVLGTLAGVTSDGQVLVLRVDAAQPAIRYLRIETVSSPSWVAWREIEVVASGP